MKPASNPYLDHICSVTGEKVTCAAVAAFVRTHRATAQSLDGFALRLGVTKIIEEPMPFDGGVFHPAPGEILIKLNSKSPYMRRRFTLAHEIGHLLLGKPGLRSSCGQDRALERTCDAIASELLMPLDESSNYVRSLGQPSPEKLKAISSKYGVSLQAAAIRVHTDLKAWKCCIGFWDRHPDVRTVWFVGRRRWDHTDPSAYALDSALNGAAPVRLSELWQRGVSAEPVWLNLLRMGGGRVLGLVAFVS